MFSLRFITAIAASIFILTPIVIAENIDPDEDDSQYAYGQNVGWFNFEPTQGPGVTVSDDKLVGYVWQQNIGWVSLSCENTDSCGTVNYGVANDGSGNLSGYAYSANAGWINFAPYIVGDSNDYGVVIDANGVFDGWAYGQNIGWIHFQSDDPIAYRVKANIASLLLLTPNGSERIPIDEYYVVTWQTKSTVKRVEIWYSLDGGSNWNKVVPANAGNIGKYNWFVPHATSNQTLMYIADSTDPNISDTSNAVFALIAKPSPMNGWGSNGDGQTDITSGDYIAFAAGRDFTLALKSDGSITGWGANIYSVISNIPTGDNFIAISASVDHALALRSNGTIAGWGKNDSGQATPPVQLDHIAIAAGGSFSAAIWYDTTIVAWGDDTYGQLSNVPMTTGFSAISLGMDHGLALSTDGSLYAWGRNNYNQVSDTPVGSDFVAIAAGWYHNLALKTDGTIVAWGRNDQGQTTVPSNSDFTSISAGAEHSIALKSDGSIIAWGLDAQGQATAPSGNDFTAITAGGYHNVAMFECPSSLSADLTGDCRVDFKDLAKLAEQWLNCADPFDAGCTP